MSFGVTHGAACRGLAEKITELDQIFVCHLLSVVLCGMDELIIDSVFMSKTTQVTAQVTIASTAAPLLQVSYQNGSFMRVGWQTNLEFRSLSHL